MNDETPTAVTGKEIAVRQGVPYTVTPGRHRQCWLVGPSVQQPDGTWIDARGHRICGAKSRHNPGGHCHALPIITPGRRPGRCRCRMHGGTSKAGIGSLNFRHGRDSDLLIDHLPLSLARHFRPDDTRLLDLTNELAVAQGTLYEAGDRLKAKEPLAPPWADLWAEVLKMVKAREKGQKAQVQAAFEKIVAMAEAGASVADDRATLMGILDQRARLVAVDGRRRKDEQELVDRARFGQFVNAILLAVASLR